MVLITMIIQRTFSVKIIIIKIFLEIVCFGVGSVSPKAI
jgi:hypothetical protein